MKGKTYVKFAELCQRIGIKTMGELYQKKIDWNIKSNDDFIDCVVGLLNEIIF